MIKEWVVFCTDKVVCNGAEKPVKEVLVASTMGDRESNPKYEKERQKHYGDLIASGQADVVNGHAQLTRTGWSHWRTDSPPKGRE